MKKFVQIYNNKAWWIFEAEEKQEFAPDIIIKDITDLNPQPQEGWNYDEITGVFTEPVIELSIIEPQPTLEEMQTQALLNTEYLVIMSEISNV